MGPICHMGRVLAYNSLAECGLADLADISCYTSFLFLVISDSVIAVSVIANSLFRLYLILLYQIPLYQFPLSCYIRFHRDKFGYTNFQFHVIANSVISDSVISNSVISWSPTPSWGWKVALIAFHILHPLMCNHSYDNNPVILKSMLNSST